MELLVGSTVEQATNKEIGLGKWQAFRYKVQKSGTLTQVTFHTGEGATSVCTQVKAAIASDTKVLRGTEGSLTAVFVANTAFTVTGLNAEVTAGEFVYICILPAATGALKIKWLSAGGTEENANVKQKTPAGATTKFSEVTEWSANEGHGPIRLEGEGVPSLQVTVTQTTTLAKIVARLQSFAAIAQAQVATLTGKRGTAGEQRVEQLTVPTLTKAVTPNRPTISQPTATTRQAAVATTRKVTVTDTPTLAHGKTATPFVASQTQEAAIGDQLEPAALKIAVTVTTRLLRATSRHILAVQAVAASIVKAPARTLKVTQSILVSGGRSIFLRVTQATATTVTDRKTYEPPLMVAEVPEQPVLVDVLEEQ